MPLLRINRKLLFTGVGLWDDFARTAIRALTAAQAKSTDEEVIKIRLLLEVGSKNSEMRCDQAMVGRRLIVHLLILGDRSRSDAAFASNSSVFAAPTYTKSHGLTWPSKHTHESEES